MHAIPTMFMALAAVAPLGAAAAPAPAEPDDAAALRLADKPAEAAAARSWRFYVEAAGGRDGWRDDADATTSSRLAADFRWDGAVAPGLRAVLSDRLDVVRQGAPRSEQRVNALREAYVSWNRGNDLVLDAGRVNIRHGAAWGYNPTDWFRGGALRAVVSPDPAVLRENRMGTVVLQAQKLWASSALSAAVSPKLGDRPGDATWSLDLGATNPRTRWLLAASHKFGERFSPELLLHGGVDTPMQVGLNASVLASDAVVAFAELSAGRDRALLGQALGTPAERRMQRRAAAGLTITTTFNLSLTAEADASSAAPTRGEWDALTATDRLRLLDTAQTLQELPARRGAFLYATWKDAGVRRLDVSGFVRWEFATHSRSQWLEARYHWDRMDLALQWQVYSGAPGSIFGTVPQARAVELSLRFYL